MAWRNSNRCVGRLFWESLNVVDARDIYTEQHFLDALHNHLSKATNGGKSNHISLYFLQLMHLKYITIN